jgi:hypothetical protein
LAHESFISIQISVVLVAKVPSYTFPQICLRRETDCVGLKLLALAVSKFFIRNSKTKVMGHLWLCETKTMEGDCPTCSDTSAESPDENGPGFSQDLSEALNLKCSQTPFLSVDKFQVYDAFLLFLFVGCF